MMKGLKIAWTSGVLCVSVLTTWTIVAAADSDDKAPLFHCDFESATLGELSDEFLILDGDFSVKNDGSNKFLELPGAPLESFGVMFGPTEREGVAVSARILGKAKGRRLPTFAVGLNGVAGYRLRVSAAKRLVELYKGDKVVASRSYRWTPDEWTWLRLSVRKSGDKEWHVSGRVWGAEGVGASSTEISWTETDEPFAGRASVWGSPYSGLPIQFDDFSVSKASRDP